MRDGAEQTVPTAKNAIFLLAAANKSRVENGIAGKCCKNVSATPEARFKQRARKGNTHGEKMVNNAGNTEGYSQKRAMIHFERSECCEGNISILKL